MRRNLPYTSSATSRRLAAAEAGHEPAELDQVRNAEERALLPKDDFRIRSDDVCPLRRNGANGLVVDPQQEPHAVPVVALTHTDELLSAEWMKRVRYTHKASRSDRRACTLS